MLKLSVPKDLEYGEEFQGSVQLTLKNGDPIPSAVLTLQMGDDYMTVITDKDGKKKFTGVMDSNESITLTASFSGSSQYYPSYDEKKISFKEEQDPFLTASDLFTTNALIIYLLLGGCGFYIWRRKQIHYLMSIVHDTALRLDSGENPKQVIIIAYNLMCRHLRRFNLLRRRDETVSEFKDQVMENLKLSDDGVGNLTSLFEYADYSSSETTEHHKDNAVHGLRNVEKELAGVSTRGRRK